MLVSEVVALMRAEGLKTSSGHVNYMIYTGRVEDPPRDGAGTRHFQKKHVAQVRAYLKGPRPRGRKKIGSYQPTGGAKP